MGWSRVDSTDLGVVNLVGHGLMRSVLPISILNVNAPVLDRFTMVRSS